MKQSTTFRRNRLAVALSSAIAVSVDALTGDSLQQLGVSDCWTT